MITRNIQLIFPTPIAKVSFGDDVDFSEYAKIILNMPSIIENDFSKNYSSNTSDDLHKNAQFSKLVSLIDFECQQLFDEYAIKKNTLQMNSMWGTVKSNGGKHHYHMHPNSYYSGVVYLQIDNHSNSVGDIEFIDPRYANRLVCPTFDGDSPLSYRSWVYSPKVGDMYIFPSWLEHGTSYFKSDDINSRRVCLTFNYVLLECDYMTYKLNMKIN